MAIFFSGSAAAISEAKAVAEAPSNVAGPTYSARAVRAASSTEATR